MNRHDTAGTPEQPHGRVGMSDVVRVERGIRKLRALDYRSGGGSCSQAVRRSLREFEGMLDRADGDTVRERLSVAIADLHNLAGWTSFDLGLVTDAHEQFDRALELAKAAENDDLVANIHYRKGRVYLHHDDPGKALDEFNQGRHPAKRASSALALAILSANQAWAHAKMGHDAEAVRLLDQARTEFDRSDVDNAPPWAAFFDETDLTAMIGTVHTELAQTHDPSHAKPAITALNSAIEGYGDDMARSRAFNLTALAINHLIQGDFDASLTASEQAVELSAGIQSTRIKDRMRPLRERSKHHAHSGDAREIAERIDTFLVTGNQT